MHGSHSLPPTLTSTRLLLHTGHLQVNHRKVKKKVVQVYLRGTSPSDQYVNTLDVDPPGQQPITNIPMAASGSICRAWAKPNVTNGNTINWDNIPMAAPIGLRRCFMSALISMVLPIPNMININVVVMTISDAIFSADGPFVTMVTFDVTFSPVTEAFISNISLKLCFNSVPMFGFVNSKYFLLTRWPSF